MDRLRVRVDIIYAASVVLLLIYAGQFTNAVKEEYFLDGGASSPYHVEIASLERQRRAATTASSDPQTPMTPVETTVANVSASAVSTSVYETTNSSKGPEIAVPTVAVTQTPLLGVNGSGQLHVNPTDNMPKVSEPIMPDDNFTDFTNGTKIYDTHSFYNSTFIGDSEYFNDFWANISMPQAYVHPILSNSHRRATAIRLSFDFPFYGKYIRNITVATGGFIYTGEHVHNWLAATQYIAPLMANFDTTLTNDSVIRLVDEGDNFTAIWENVTLQENSSQKFTFSATLFKSGDIVFAYKSIPIEVQDILDADHPVKVGISDAYLTDKIVFYVRRKTIYEYHRVSFKDHKITNNTILKLVSLPTCLQYDTCDSCLKHTTGFNCTWCPQIGKCSSGTDRHKQDWLLRRCEQTATLLPELCIQPKNAPAGPNETYVTEIVPEQTDNHTSPTVVEYNRVDYPVNATLTHEPHSPIGGVVGAFLAIAIVCSAAAWMLYAFKNPHTPSGQLLIKYRPTQWNWRRGEARYTAATIHM